MAGSCNAWFKLSNNSSSDCTAPFAARAVVSASGAERGRASITGSGSGARGRGRLLHQREQLPDPLDDLTRLERLDQHAVGLHLLGARLIHRLESPCQQQHRDVRQIGVALDEGRDLVAALARHADVGQDDVGTFDGNAGNGLLAVADGQHLHVLAGERQLDDSLDRDAVVRQQ